MLHTLFKELLLKLHDTRHDLYDRLIPLLDTANDPLRRPQLFIQIGLRLRRPALS